MQLYRGMDIGTAKLPLDGAPRHPAPPARRARRRRDEASVADYQADARAAIDEIRARGAVPILVGGSRALRLVACSSTSASRAPTPTCARGSRPSSLAARPGHCCYRRLHEVDPGGRSRDRPAQRPAARARARGGRAHRRAVRRGPARRRRVLAPDRDDRPSSAARASWSRASTRGSQRMWRDGLLDEVRGAARRPASDWASPRAARSATRRRSPSCDGELDRGRGDRADRGAHPPVRAPPGGLVRALSADCTGSTHDDPAPRRSARPCGQLALIVCALSFTSPRATAPATTSCCSPTPTASSSSTPDAARRASATATSASAPTASSARCARRSLPEGAAALAEDDGAEWFMDYHNADGQPRRCAATASGSTRLPDRERPGSRSATGETLADRHPRRRARRAAQPRAASRSTSAAGRSTAASRSCAPRTSTVARPGLGIDVGNPHVVVALPTTTSSTPPTSAYIPVLDPEPADGANVEFVVPADPLVRRRRRPHPDARARARQRRDALLRHRRGRGGPGDPALGRRRRPEPVARRGSGRHARRADVRRPKTASTSR